LKHFTGYYRVARLNYEKIAKFKAKIAKIAE
jgi:hypothetical protein